MRYNKISVFIFLSILDLSLCARAIIHNKMPKLIENAYNLMTKNDITHSSFRNLDGSGAKLIKVNSTATFSFHEDYRFIEHRLVLIPPNIKETEYFPGWGFILYMNLLYDISCSCEVRNNSAKKECIASYKIEKNKIIFDFEGKVFNGDILIINYKYKEKKTFKELLLITEEVQIPLSENSLFCDYKFIIPDGFIDLGLINDILIKQSDTTYIYYGQCPPKIKKEGIRYSPEKATLEGNVKILFENPFKFTANILLISPRYYIGGKLRNKIYELSSLDNELYKEENYIYDNIYYKFIFPAVNKNKVGIKLHTVFTNNFHDEFEVYFPESYYDIDLSKIDQEIIDKANEIIKEKSDKPNYYKIGKFIKSYMEYDESISQNLTLKEIYEGRKGVCKHYTLLYNAMLNAIGIKTLFVSGWAFYGNETLGNWEKMAHAWTAALIDNKWKELDVTNQFLKGVPVANVMRDFCEAKHFYTELPVKEYELKIISINQRFIYLEKSIITLGIGLGIFIVLLILFYIKRKYNKSRLHSQLIEEIKNFSGENNSNV